MNSSTQTYTAIAVVLIALLWLVRRALVKRQQSGCGGECGCPSSELKAKVKDSLANDQALARR